MAEVTDRDRGQLLLVAGIVLAVLFVALALLVNTAIYTDNVATRDGDAASEPLAYQEGAVSVASGLIEAENEDGDDFGTIESNVRDGFEESLSMLEQRHLQRAATTETGTSGFTEGRHIQQSDGIDNWGVSGADGVRAFSMTLERGSMDSIDIDDEDDPDPFNIDLGDGELEVYLDAENDDDLTVSVDGEVRCRVDASGDVSFDVTDERLDGKPCPLGLSSDLDDDFVGFDNADTVDGEYELIVATTSEPAAPEVSEVLYSVVLDVGIHSPDRSYESRVTVAPGEFDD
ncbi:uncharacterized protein NP_4014A [Natronomonas pharaonis DSM 2160]|uniref:Uncharacterized protein n=1 Tax=Natronomonas pharaonis (strain ATCC 35678 / DSM 2160 / CIP 103997 / JCM 8858 / NBRC 14720 / NCIMB 2260 / Gabara) TaxID=348780 RepID=A0A1U7EY03_NATPD|nr:hypothetical protein [Natronomonas pharaonis]CAI50098.2 uncharacterized protein NP_4014A [Natronomonas pharaonis DSM 2160]